MSEKHSESLGEALPKAIALVSEFIGKQEQMAAEMDATLSGAGAGNRMIAQVLRAERDMAQAAFISGDVVAMIRAYEKLKPAIELATPDTEETDNG